MGFLNIQQRKSPFVVVVVALWSNSRPPNKPISHLNKTSRRNRVMPGLRRRMRDCAKKGIQNLNLRPNPIVICSVWFRFGFWLSCCFFPLLVPCWCRRSSLPEPNLESIPVDFFFNFSMMAYLYQLYRTAIDSLQYITFEEKKNFTTLNESKKGERTKQEKAKRVAGFQNNFQKEKSRTKRKGPSWKLCWVLEEKNRQNKNFSRQRWTQNSITRSGPGLGRECVA